MVGIAQGKMILFDLGGTLIDLKVPYDTILAEYFIRNNLPWDNRIKQYLVESRMFVEIHEGTSPSGYIQQAIKFVSLAQLSFDVVPIVIQAILQVRQAIQNPELWKMNDYVLDFLQQFRLSCRYAILSNWDSSFIDFYKWFGFDQYCDFYICSSEVGVAKPDPTIFRIAVTASSRTQDELIYIGNDLELDYYPAKSLGIQTFVFDPNQRLEIADEERFTNYRQLALRWNNEYTCKGKN